MVSLAKLLRIRQGIEEKYKNIGLEKFRLSIISKLKTNLMKTQRGALLNTQIMRSKTKN
jgi:hypothetical protein